MDLGEHTDFQEDIIVMLVLSSHYLGNQVGNQHQKQPSRSSDCYLDDLSNRQEYDFGDQGAQVTSILDFLRQQHTNLQKIDDEQIELELCQSSSISKVSTCILSWLEIRRSNFE